jgi:hypothetical protein
MRIHITKPLFAWDCLDDSPDLKTLERFLAAVPDGRLLDALRRWRGRGRDDYPVHVLWGVCLLRVALRMRTFEDMLAELRRNPSLARRIGIDSPSQVPRKWNISRFLEVLGQQRHLTMVREIFDQMIGRLGEVVKDLGRQTAGDATGLLAALPRSRQGRRSALAQPTGGRKEYTDEAGKVTAVIEWFGYKLHLLVDVKHEVALAYEVTSANAGDNEQIEALVSQAEANLGVIKPGEPPPSAQQLRRRQRIRTLAYDKAADDQDVHKLLAAHGIAPLIENRSLWTQEPERMLPGHDGRSNVVYDEAGTLYCYDKVSDPPVRHRMAYIGHEPGRGTLKYRCPAMHEGWPCPSHRRCNGRLRYGKTVRVKQEIDLRRFPPIPRATRKFERLYKGRTSVERVNARLKLFWGADDGNITGAERFHATVGLVMIVHAGFATLLASCPRYEGTLSRTRLSPIAVALHRKLAP